MLWLRILMACRPLWQLCILVLYSFATQLKWEEAAIGSCGAALLASNVVLAIPSSHPMWRNIRRVTLVVEAVILAAMEILLSNLWQLGPATLLLLPTLITYLWLYDGDVFQWLLASFIVVIYWWRSGAVFGQGPIHLLTPAERAEAVPQIAFGLYGAVLAFGVFLGFLLQRQRHDGERLRAALYQVEDQTKRLAEANEQVRTYANEVYALATAEERNRIAGEIHDIAAHRLTALLVQLQAARRILAAEGDVAATTDNLHVCESLAREALEEIRRSVRSVRTRTHEDGMEVLRR
ncbi:MAG: hypothetical protein K6T83_11620, partial [Alicyclobacillus sp.]|nr:hypothetical protein [Alicyclobacillus sp.]